VGYLQLAGCHVAVTETCRREFVDTNNDGDGDTWQDVCTSASAPVQDATAIADVIEAVDWVTANADRPAVAVLDFAHVGSSPGLDQAMRDSVAAGVTWTVPAGESAHPACDHTPSWLGDPVDGVITVGATDSSDRYVLGTGWGPCVDIFAPGLGVDSPTALTVTTPVAAALTAGVIAQYLEPAPNWTPAQLEAHLKAQATTGKVTRRPTNTPDLLLHSAWWGPVLRVTCDNNGTSDTEIGGFTCWTGSLNGPVTGQVWEQYVGSPPAWQHQPSANGSSFLVGTCAYGSWIKARVTASRNGHSQTGTSPSLKCALSN
jgi:hypothetical protein